MRPYLTTLSFALATLLGAIQAVADNPPAGVKVDSYHWMNKEGAGDKAYAYSIRPCEAVILEAGDFKFVPPKKHKGQPPNVIRLTSADGAVYESGWQPGQTRYELSEASLRPMSGAPTFRRFEKGAAYTIQIGIVDPDERFNEMWVSRIEVH